MLPGMDLSRMTLDEVQAPAAASGRREWEETGIADAGAAGGGTGGEITLKPDPAHVAGIFVRASVLLEIAKNGE